MNHKIKRFLDTKAVFIAVGMINIIVFHYAIYRLWFFLYDSSNRLVISNPLLGLLINLTLVLLFTIPHSILLQSKYKKILLSYIPNHLYSTIYSLHASISIILMDQFWVGQGVKLIPFEGTLETVMSVIYGLGWLLMFWSMVSTGLFRQSGIEEWWLSINNKNYRNSLPKSGPYQICRHPIYASFIVMIWFTPNMTFDRLFLAITWTTYILIGASLKERRLRRNKGYISYSENVPSFPFIPKRIDNYLMKYITGNNL